MYRKKKKSLKGAGTFFFRGALLKYLNPLPARYAESRTKSIQHQVHTPVLRSQPVLSLKLMVSGAVPPPDISSLNKEEEASAVS